MPLAWFERITNATASGNMSAAEQAALTAWYSICPVHLIHYLRVCSGPMLVSAFVRQLFRAALMARHSHGTRHTGQLVHTVMPDWYARLIEYLVLYPIRPEELELQHACQVVQGATRRHPCVVTTLRGAWRSLWPFQIAQETGALFCNAAFTDGIPWDDWHATTRILTLVLAEASSVTFSAIVSSLLWARLGTGTISYLRTVAYVNRILMHPRARGHLLYMDRHSLEQLTNVPDAQGRGGPAALAHEGTQEGTE